MSEQVHCQKCGDFVCDACGGPPGAAQVIVTPKRRPIARALLSLAVLAVSIACAGAIAKVAYRMFLFGWELIP